MKGEPKIHKPDTGVLAIDGRMIRDRDIVKKAGTKQSEKVVMFLDEKWWAVDPREKRERLDTRNKKWEILASIDFADWTDEAFERFIWWHTTDEGSEELEGIAEAIDAERYIFESEVN
jgi:hypothetical protein